MFLSVMAAALLFRTRFVNRYSVYFIVFAGILTIPYHAMAVKNEYFHTLYLPREFYTVMAEFKEKDPTKTLMIADAPDMYSGHHISVVDFEFANEKKESLAQLVDELGIKDVLVAQRINPESGEVHENTKLDPFFQTKTLKEIKLHPQIDLRLAQVIDFHETSESA